MYYGNFSKRLGVDIDPHSDFVCAAGILLKEQGKLCVAQVISYVSARYRRSPVVWTDATRYCSVCQEGVYWDSDVDSRPAARNTHGCCI